MYVKRLVLYFCFQAESAAQIKATKQVVLKDLYVKSLVLGALKFQCTWELSSLSYPMNKITIVGSYIRHDIVEGYCDRWATVVWILYQLDRLYRLCCRSYRPYVSCLLILSVSIYVSDTSLHIGLLFVDKFKADAWCIFRYWFCDPIHIKKPKKKEKKIGKKKTSIPSPYERLELYSFSHLKYTQGLT